MSLTALLQARIAADGPISVAEFMQDCLLHPQFGYYSTRDPFGAAGDFTTAPEISQMFGELLGLCLVQIWQDQGCPAPVTLAEIGPGRGTLMRDALRAAARVPGFAPQVVLIEASPHLRDVQARTLAPYDVLWVEDVGQLPTDQALLLVANEFFDALPIRQYQRSGEGWCEVRLGAPEGRLAWGLGQRHLPDALMHRLEDTGEGDIVERCPAAGPIIQQIAERLSAQGGAALVIDYGDWRARGDTLQALRAHTPVDPLDAPGAADVTAHVDFEALAQAASRAGARVTPMTPQGVFLERLGITPRAQSIAKTLSGAALQSHIAAHRRLTHPEEMGNLFKVMGLAPPHVPPLPGLEV